VIGEIKDVTATASGQANVIDKVATFVAAAKAATVDGLTWVEFGQLMLALLHLTVESLDAVTGMTGAEKKAMALDGVARLFDALADRAVPFAAWPVWIVVRPSVRALVLAIASGAVEHLLPMIREKA